MVASAAGIYGNFGQANYSAGTNRILFMSSAWDLKTILNLMYIITIRTSLGKVKTKLASSYKLAYIELE